VAQNGSSAKHGLSPTVEYALRVCPPLVEQRLRGLATKLLEDIEEIRFRLQQPVQLCGAGIDGFLHVNTGLTRDVSQAYIVSQEDITRVVQVVTQSSLYAVEDELRRGFVTMPGGNRVGIGGRAVLYETGQVRSIRNITSVNVRIAKERFGVADRLRQHAYHAGNGKPESMLIISPPQCGKTTLLRDLSRQWSEGLVRGEGRAVKVAIIDERSEVAGCVDGIPQFRVGPRTDVLDACPKAEGMLMAIRSLSPDIIVTDEIGRSEDRDAVLEAAHSGVAVITTAHASSLEEWSKRPFMGALREAGAFSRYVILSRRLGPCTLERVYDGAGTPIPSNRQSMKGLDRA